MIIPFSKNKHFSELIGFLAENNTNDFYITSNNERIVVQDADSLNTLLENCTDIFIEDNGGSINGIVAIWEAKGGDKVRSYVKLLAIDLNVASNLLKALVYNINKELFIKIKKDSALLPIFKNHNFKFKNGRGKEILLYREK